MHQSATKEILITGVNLVSRRVIFPDSSASHFLLSTARVRLYVRTWLYVREIFVAGSSGENGEENADFATSSPMRLHSFAHWTNFTAHDSSTITTSQPLPKRQHMDSKRVLDVCTIHVRPGLTSVCGWAQVRIWGGGRAHEGSQEQPVQSSAWMVRLVGGMPSQISRAC